MSADREREGLQALLEERIEELSSARHALANARARVLLTEGAFVRVLDRIDEFDRERENEKAAARIEGWERHMPIGSETLGSIRSRSEAEAYFPDSHFRQEAELAAAEEDSVGHGGERRDWRFTFGQKYRHETHPNYPQADPAGWVTISATSEDEAISKALEIFGTDECGFGLWAFHYSEESWDAKWFDRGEIERFETPAEGAGA